VISHQEGAIPLPLGDPPMQKVIHMIRYLLAVQMTIGLFAFDDP
jgi:hypothetical protein